MKESTQFLPDCAKAASSASTDVIAAAPASLSSTITSTTTTSSSSSSILESPQWFFGLTSNTNSLKSNDNLLLVPDDDNQSIASNGSSSSSLSIAYFDPSDLHPSNWLVVLNDNVPTIGWAALAVAAAITHPFVLIVAVAAAATYKYNQTENDDTAEEKNTAQQQTKTTNTTSSSCDGLPSFCHFGMLPDLRLDDDDDNDYTTIETTHSKKNEYCEKNSTSSSPVPVPSTSATTGPTPPDSSSSVPNNNGNMKLVVEPFVPDQAWLEQQYPPLTNSVMDKEQFIGLNVVEFFNVFFADDAPYNFLEFQKKRGDTDIVYQPWSDVSLSRADALSLHPCAFSKKQSSAIPHYELYQQRTMYFKAKTGGFPPYATTCKTQRILVINKRLAVLESKTVLADIPFCDRFCVMERWLLTAQKLHANTRATHVQARCEAVFSKPFAFGGQIATKSCAAVCQVTGAWCEMAKEALQLAEQAKNDRLLRQTRSTTTPNKEQPYDNDDNILEEEGIEVDHSAFEQKRRPASTASSSRLSRLRQSVLGRRNSGDL
jgi:hypothetical protein